MIELINRFLYISNNLIILQRFIARSDQEKKLSKLTE